MGAFCLEAMENSKNTLIILLVIGIVLVGIAFFLRYRAQQPPPPSAPGYYEGPMLPKSQRMGPPGGGTPPTGGAGAPQGAPR